jgi:large repetitive protein
MDDVYDQELVNTFTDSNQDDPAITVLADGSYVVVWTSYTQDGETSYGVYAQHFSASGLPIGPEFRVNSTTSGNQSAASITALSDGGFVVTWTDSAKDGSAEGIYAQRYDSSGVAQGSEFLVNTYTNSTQNQSSVAAYTGGFIVTWTSFGNPGDVSSYGVYAQRYNNDGTLNGGEFRVNTTTTGYQYESDVAANSDGSFVVVWRSDGQDGSSAGVYAQRYDNSGTAAGSEFKVNTYTTGNQYEPKVAMLAGGGFVVVWRSDNQDGSSAGVYAQRYDASGVAQGSEFRVNETTAGGQYQPDVAALANGGFVVTWFNDNYDASGTGSYADVYVREYDADGVAVTGEVKVNAPDNNTQSQPAIAHLGSDNYVVVWTDSANDGSGEGVFQQLFGTASELPRQANPELGDFTGTVTFAENLVNTTPQIIDHVVSLTDIDSADFDGGRVEIFYTQYGSAEDQLGVRNQGTGVGQIGVSGNTVSFNDGTGAVTIGTISGGTNGTSLIIDLNANATVDAVETLIENLTYANTSDNPQASRTVALRVYDGDGGSSNAGSVTINVTRELDGTPLAYGEEAVNTYTTGTQDTPAIASLADGSYVVAWTSADQDDGGTGGVYAQRFSASGVAIGPEFRVNSTTASTTAAVPQSDPALAGLSDGGFVVVWHSYNQDVANTWGVYSQRYDVSGNAVGGETLVNTYTANQQYQPSVAAYSDGYVVAWASTGNAGGSGYDIYFQRYLNDGTPQGGETRVNTTLTSTQYQPDVDARADGSFVVVWEDLGGADGNGYGVYAQRYSNGGVTDGGQILVNTYTTGNQYEPKVATLTDGGFVVVWRSDNQDGSSAGVYAQRFDAAGAKVGGEFRVNDSTTGGQYQPDVTALSTGGFVVTWYNDNYDIEGTGTTADVYIREYDAAGNPVDGQRKLLSGSNSTEYQPAIADLGNGNFAVVYADYNTTANGGNNTYEIRQQIFGDTAELPRQANPSLADFTGTVTFAENTVNAGLQVIDAAVGLSDPDSGNFNGGRLDLYFIQNGAAEDQLGVVHEGNGAGQIGVSGNTVSYGGVAIGTISGGTNGANLRIDFTSDAATIEAVQALIERLGYANTDSSPNASRTLGLRVSDGDGGSSAPNVLTIDVTPELDGTPLAYGEEAVNTYTTGTQDTPAIASLADGSYVVAWTSADQDDGGTGGVYAQRFSASGVAIGPEFRVNSTTASTTAAVPQSDPALAGLSDGGFVVVWHSYNQDVANTWGVYSQRYDVSGNAVGGETLVNTYTANQQYQPSVAAYSDGYVVAWASTGNAGGSGYDIYFQRYLNDGTPQGGETRVNTTLTSTQYQPDVDARADGSFVVVWEDLGGADGNGYGVYAQRYSNGGVTDGGQILVNTYTTGNQYEPKVATLTDGGFVVVWRSDNQDGSSAGVYAQRFDAAGAKVGGEFRVNDSTTGGQYQPDVTALSTGGFVVTWYNDNYDIEGTGTTADVYIREYDAAGNPVDGQRKLLSGSNSTEYQPAIADLGNGNFAVVYADYNTTANGGNNTYEIRQQIFGDTAELPRQANPSLADFTGTVTFAENTVNAGLQVIDAAVGLSDPDSGNFNGGRLDLYFIQNGAAEDQLGVVHEGNGAGQIGVSGNTVSYGGVAIGTISGGTNGANLRIDFTSDAATIEAVQALIERLGYANTDSSPNASRTLGLRVSDGDGGSSAPNVLTIDVTPELDGTPLAYGEEAVNTYTTGTQDTPAIASLADGSYVVAWTSADQDDGGTGGVYAQRFSASGVAIGPEFRINSTTAGAQNDPTVAGLSDGGFVVAWVDSVKDGSGQGVYAQRYDASGNAVGGETLVNTYVSSTQYQPSVAAYSDGYVVTWASTGNAGGSGYDIYFQRYLNDGTPQGGETRVNTTLTSTQYQPDVDARADGSFVVVWEDLGGADGNGYGVYAQRYSNGGVTDGGQILVNTYTTGNQYEPKVATLTDGGFVVVWRSDNQDGSSAGVYAQRFDAAGAKVGGEFRVNDSTTGGQYQPDVTALSTGGFVVTWYNDNYDIEGTGTTADVYIREYDAAGNPVDGQRKLLSGSNSTEYQPAIADLGNGNFAVVYADYNTTANGGNNTYEIRQQIFGDTAELLRTSGSPVVDDLRKTLTLSYSNASPFYAANPQVIDPDVYVTDSDSPDFAGGSLIVTFLDGTSTTHVNETLAIRNEGTGTGQIGISGNDVSYAGVTIGSFSGGTAGTNLVVNLNASATAEAVQALIQNITYVNSAPGAAQTDRYIGFRLFDGDGGASSSTDVLVRIQATVTPPTVDLQDIETAVTLSETQAQAGAVLDPGVQLIYSGATGFNGGSLTVSYALSTGRVEDQLSIRNEGTGTGQVSVSGSDVSYEGTLIGTINAADTGANGDQLVINFNASATDQAIERVIENLTYQTTSDGPNPSRTISIVVRDSASVASTASQMVITVMPEVDGASPLFGEQQVNTYEPDQQEVPVVTGLQGANAGGYVVLWRSNGQDGGSYGIYGQRYDAKGAAVGAEFQVNSQTLGAQVEPDVASLANGGFVAVWTDRSGEDGSSYGVYAQIYGADGAPVGGEFQVNTTTLSNQYEPVVVGLTDGSFVVAYRSDYTGTTYTPDEILAKRYSATGTLLNDEFTVNTTTMGTQFEPRLAALSGGQFVAVWADTSNDGSGYGVFSKVFNADGSEAVAEQRVNTTLIGNQYGPDVAALSGGGYVAVWWSADNQIYGQRFDAAGNKTGGEFQVSTVDTAANNNYARVTALDSGGFVVAWDANAYDVFIQQYDASGNKIDGATRVNSTTVSTQYFPDIAGLSGSNFVVTWSGYNQESGTANTYGIFSQIMGTPGSITRSAAPELVDVASSVTFAENLVNATPQLIDGSVRLSDVDSANFNGGQLVVAIIPAGQNQAVYSLEQDQLGIRNQGADFGQIGVSGNDISYGGTVIGTLVANGANLVVNLNTNATSQAVEALIENLTYANTSTDPAASRLVSIQVSDGAGGASAPRTVQITVTPEVDGASPLFGEQQVNTYEPDQQEVPVVTGLQGANAGGYVVLWRSNGQDGGSYGIYGQRYDAKGAAVGAEFQVNSQTLGAQVEPDVASLANGGFVAVWTDRSGEDGSSYGVYAQIYGADGAPVGGEFQVNTTTLSNQYEPVVVGLTDGSFVVAYRSDYTGTTYTPDEILAKRYSATGTLLNDEFTVNTTTMGTQFEPRLAALSGGQFVAVWADTSNDGSGYGVFSKVFNADGSEAVAEQRVNTTLIGNQYGPDVAALSGGGYVAVWWSADNQIYGQRFDAAGNKTGGEFQVSTVDTAANNNYARVTALDSGGFVVAWDANAYDVFIQQYDASGNKIDGATRVNSTTVSTQYFPDIAGLSGSNFVVTWSGYNQESGTANTYGIFSQIMGTPGSITRSAAPELVDVASSVTFAENLVNATPQLIDGSVRLSDVDSANFNGGQLVVSVISGYGNIEQAQLPQDPYAQDQFGIRNQGTGFGQVGVSGNSVTYGGTIIGTITSNGANGSDLIVTFNASASVQAVEAVIENLTYANTVSNPVASRTVSIQVSDGAGGASAPRVLEINVTPEYDGAQPLFEEEVVNTYTPDTQSQPAMARLADGGYVTVWTSNNQDGWGEGIYGQRYDAQGVPVGNQFQVNDYTPYGQNEPAVASLSSGGFVVVWTDQARDSSSYGVYAQRYDADGLQAGDAFLVNSNVDYEQSQPTVASLPGGGFVVAWYSYYQDGQYQDVYFQRFDDNGVPLGAETRANTSLGYENQSQSEPAITVLSDGTFVVTWTSTGQDNDGGYSGVFAQRFAANGTPLGDEFQVNTYTDYWQFEPSIAALTGGGFVVTWTSYYQDGGSTYGVFAQRHANDGTRLGGEFRVNTTVDSSENQPSVSALGNGGFVIAWSNSNQIYAQQFDANGIPVDGETRVDVKDNNYATDPAVLGLNNGNFVVSWTDYQDDASANSYGIFQRLFGDPADFTRQANPELVDVAQSVTFGENAVNLAPQLIDPGVGLYDADSPDFAGGRLEVDYISGYGGQDQLGFEGLENQDQLGIRSEGNGPTQVGVSGLNVYYSGVQVGTIIADGTNHGKLVVEFNASATVAAVESVIENLTYQNTSSNPFPSRTISIRLTDGDGGASDARFVTINVTPEVDGAVPVGLERQVNTTVANTQEQPSISHLADGGYVVVWQSYSQDAANTWGVYGQRYDADDNPVGSEFLVNTATASSQYEPQVAGLSGGGYVVVWRADGAQDGSGAGVYAQRYDTAGSPVGSEFLVNTTTSSNQYQPDITATSDGGFVVSWYHDWYSASETEYADIFFQRYDGTGAAVDGETRANPPLGSIFLYQSEPKIAWLDGGGFVVVWTDSSSTDGSGDGVYGQRFDASGNAVGSTFRANTYTTSNQSEPDVAALKDGGYIVVWRSEGQDLSGAGIYAQRYDASGNTIGTEFRVNTTTSSNQLEPAVTGLENGGWVVTWTDQYGAAPSVYDVFLQQYDAGGRQVDGQTLVNTYTGYIQQQPTITSMADGGFVVAYSSYVYSSDQNGDGIPDGGNDTFEVRLQRYSNTAPILTDVFVSGQEDAPVVLTDELFISGFNDPEGQNLAAIKIITLPAQGTLKLDGVAVIPGQEISLADLQADKLVYQGNLNYFGLDQFSWTGSDGIAFAETSVYTNINLSNVNDAPALQAGADDTAAEGTFFSHAITLGDPDPDTHQVTVNWGDGTANTVYNTSADLLNISHYFPDDGIYTVTVTADDQQGQPNSVEIDSFQVTVSNVAPDLTLSGDTTVEQNTVYTLTLGAVYDPGDDTVTEYIIDWGDGTTPQSILAGDLPADRKLTHTYTEAGSKTIGVSLVDEDGTFNNVETKTITVAAPAEVLTVNAGADRTVNEGALFTQTILFDDPTDFGPAGRLYTVDWGDGNVENGRTFSAGSFNISHAYADGPNNYTVTVTVDDDGAQSDSDSFDVVVNNMAPTLSLIGNGTVAEGSLYTLNISAFDPGADTITAYSIDWGDGSAAQLLTAAELAALSGSVTHTYADGTVVRTITVQATDEDGTWTQTKDITVNNVAPTIALSGNLTVDEGSSYTLTLGAVTDPGQDTPTSYTINWGDGNAEVVDSLGDYTHVYADGTVNRTISVLVTDEDGAHANAGTLTVTVNNVPPTVALGGPDNVSEGSTYTLAIGPVTDPGTDTVSSYSIDWGDGSEAQVLTAAQLNALAGDVTHVYADGLSTPTITVDLVDEDGTHLSAGSKSITVNNVAPTASVTGADSVNEGSVYTLSVGAVVDPGADTRTAYSIDWGDGAVENFTPAEWAAAAGSFSHTYADGVSTPTISVSTTDEDGSFTLGSKSLTVNNVAPVIALTGADSVNEGATYTLTLGAVTDPGTDTVTSYVVNWGDGTSDTYAAAGDVTHMYADGLSTPTITVDLVDEDGTHLGAGSKSITVNNVAPTIALTGADTVDEGSVYTLSLAALVDPGTDTATAYSIDWGDGTIENFTAAEYAALGGTAQHTYADGGLGGTGRTIQVSVTDEDGSFVAGSKSITVNNVAPSVVLSGNTSTLEGATYTLNLVGSDPAGANDILSYSIDWGDGSAAQVLTAAELAALSGNVTHIFADDEDGPINATARTIQVTVSDEDGGSRIESKSVTVNNVAPVIALAGADSVVEDTTYTLTLGAVTDPGTDTVTNYVVNWGDGTQSSYAAAGDVTHTYADPGNYTISVDLTDEDGTFTSAGSKAVTVNAASATVSIEAGADATLNEGTTFTRTIAFSDGVDDGAAGWSYSIDYGDGTVVDGTTLVKSLDLSHQYADGDASHTVTVTVTDEVGETDSDSFLVTVDNVAPTIALTGADTVDEGSVYTLSLAALVDPGTDTATAYSIDWGDGTVQNFTAAEYAALAGSAQHTYADGGLGGTGRTIQVSVTDEDGSFVAGSKSITVNNVAPSVVLSGNASTLEGATYTLNLVGSDPAGANDILSYSIDWGDGSAAQVLTAAELAALSGNVTHIFADDEDGPINATARTIQVTVSDEDGGSRIESKSVTVNNVAPVIALAGADSVNEGATYTLTLGAVTDPGTDTVTNYVVNWGDGTSDTYASAGDVTHVYADGLSTPTITVDLVDEDGTHLSAGSKSITVNNVAPTASVTGADSVNEGSVYTLSVGAVVDPGADTRTAYSIDWGDGAVENFTPAEWAAAAGSFSHTYADGVSTPTISVSTTDEDGSFTLGSKSLTVNNVAPVIALTGADSVNEGATYTLTLGAVTDPGTDTVTSYVVNWGDGTSDTYAAAGDVTHMYADGLSTPTITVDLVDEDGTHLGAGSKSITVNNVAPTIALTGADTVDEGSVYTLSLAALVDPGTDTADRLQHRLG